MSIKISAAIKGLITALLMIVVFLIIYKQGKNAPGGMKYLVYSIYGLGIIWALLAYRKSSSFTGKFGDMFSQGFKCFVVITLCVALFYGIFNYMHPEFREEMAASMKETLLKEKQVLPPDIDSEVATFKKQYILKLVSGAIFGYLIIGAGVTAAASALLTRRNS
jgi:MFS family permease